MVLYDDEEVGSTSAQGACSSILENCLRRISETPGARNTYERAVAKSFLISADMGKALTENTIAIAIGVTNNGGNECVMSKLTLESCWIFVTQQRRLLQ